MVFKLPNRKNSEVVVPVMKKWGVTKGLTNNIRKSPTWITLKMFSRSDRRNMLVVLFIQISLGVLDLVGIALIGVIGSLAIAGISGDAVGDRVSGVIRLLRLEDQTLQIQISIIGGLSAAFLISKTLVTLILTNKTFTFLANRSAQFASLLVDKLLATNLKKIQEKSIQEIIYVASGGVNALILGVLGGWFNIVGDFALFMILGTGLFIIDSGIALSMTLFIVLIAALIYRRLGEQFGELGVTQANLSVKTAQTVNEIVLAFRESFVRDRGGHYAKRFRDLEFAMAKGNSRINLMSLYTKYIFEVVFVLSSIAVAAFVFTTEPVGRASAILSIFLVTGMRIIPAVVRIQQGMSKIRIQTGYAQQAIDLLKSVEKSSGTTPSSKFVPREHSGFTPEINLKRVKFDFGNEDWSLLIDEVSIRKGEFVGFVGSSGAGKTTLIDLILGLREPQTGTVEISGMPPKKAIECWPGAIAYVPQDSAILEGSIRENIVLGYETEEVEDEILWRALELAHLTEFVKGLPEGLDSKVGDRGTRLSGGQRQRLGIARAFLTAPDLIFLDEATSSLDSEIEAAISDSILKLKGRVTVVMIAHRLSTVLEADTIYFMRDGSIVDKGTFQELKLKNEQFARQAQIMGL